MLLRSVASNPMAANDSSSTPSASLLLGASTSSSDGAPGHDTYLMFVVREDDAVCCGQHSAFNVATTALPLRNLAAELASGVMCSCTLAG